MSNRRATVSQADLTRYLKAYRAAGIPVARTEISKDGKIIIISNDKDTPTTDNDWDLK